MKKVLITGITGFVGNHLASHLLSQKEYEVIGTYRSESGLDSLGGIKEKIRLTRLDLQDAPAVEKVITSEKPDYIFHLAAQASPAKSFTTPVETMTNNIVSEFSLLETLKKNELTGIRVLIISTGEIYGMVTPTDIPVDEETPLRPASPYAVSKIAQDYLSLQYHLAYKLDIIRLRPFNHIGPGQKEGFVVADFAKQIAEIEKDKKEPVISVGNLDAKRDFTDVRDMVKSYELALQKGKSGDVYNIGSGKSRKIDDILQMLLSFSSKKIDVNVDHSRFRPIDVPEIICDCSKFHYLTGWKSEIPFEKTLQDILDYWRKIV
ncbi:MAG TPA: GDP-mannose 4,6-dehydratase [Candidatus Acidoferrales bacterium]|nr:GDP-mannose 4,6-dehydratase [Candidatus Acidoferrales bacterium]